MPRSDSKAPGCHNHFILTVISSFYKPSKIVTILSIHLCFPIPLVSLVLFFKILQGFFNFFLHQPPSYSPPRLSFPLQRDIKKKKFLLMNNKGDDPFQVWSRPCEKRKERIDFSPNGCYLKRMSTSIENIGFW